MSEWVPVIVEVVTLKPTVVLSSSVLRVSAATDESVTVSVTRYSPLSGKLRSISLPSYSFESPSKFQKKDRSSPSSSEEPDAEKEMVSLI